MASSYDEKTYHLINKNSNTFTDDVANLIIGQGIPKEYKHLPPQFFQTQLGQQIVPIMMNMQKSLSKTANKLFQDDAQLPLKIRRAGDD